MYAKFFIFAFLGATFLFVQQVNAENNQEITGANNIIDEIKDNLGEAIQKVKERFEKASQAHEEASKKLRDEIQKRVKEFQARLEEARAQGEEKFEEMKEKLQPIFEAEIQKLKEGLAVLKRKYEAAVQAFNEA